MMDEPVPTIPLKIPAMSPTIRTRISPMLPFYRIDAAAGIGSGRMALYAVAKCAWKTSVFPAPPAGFEPRNVLPADAVSSKSSRGDAPKCGHCPRVRPYIRDAWLGESRHGGYIRALAAAAACAGATGNKPGRRFEA